MPYCVDCGNEVFGLDNNVVEVRCYDCEYRMNLKKAMQKTTEYCLISIGIILGVIMVVELVIGLLYNFGFRI